MTIADLRPGTLDIPMTQGNDLVLRCTFNEYANGVLVGLLDLTGFTGWEANARPDSPRGVQVLAFTVDSSAQATSIITFTLPAASTAQFTEAPYDVKAIDADGHPFTYIRGTIAAEAGVS